MSENNTAIFKPKDYSNFNLTFPEVDQLLDKIEIIKRRKIKDVDNQINYIDPLNHVKTLTNPVNHLIVGRRGSGKTSLLIKVIEEIRKTKGFVTIVDMQGKQRQNAELPLIEVLTYLFKDLKKIIEKEKNWEPYLMRKSKTRYYQLKSLYYGLTNKELWTNEIIENDKIFNSISSIISKLTLIKDTPNDSNIIITKSSKNKTQSSKSFKSLISIGADTKYLNLIHASTEASFSISIDKEINSENNFEYNGKYSKQEALDELKYEIINCIEVFYNVRIQTKLDFF